MKLFSKVGVKVPSSVFVDCNGFLFIGYSTFWARLKFDDLNDRQVFVWDTCNISLNSGNLVFNFSYTDSDGNLQNVSLDIIQGLELNKWYNIFVEVGQGVNDFVIYLYGYDVECNLLFSQNNVYSVKFKFPTTFKFGNNLYVDNIALWGRMLQKFEVESVVQGKLSLFGILNFLSFEEFESSSEVKDCIDSKNIIDLSNCLRINGVEYENYLNSDSYNLLLLKRTF